MSPLLGMALLSLLPAYLMARFYVTGRIQNRAIYLLLDRHAAWRDGGASDDTYEADWDLVRDRLQARVLDPRFWTFKSFYPEFA